MVSFTNKKVIGVGSSKVQCSKLMDQRTNVPVNAHLISRPTISTKTSFAKFDIVVNRSMSTQGHHLYKLCRA